MLKFNKLDRSVLYNSFNDFSLIILLFLSVCFLLVPMNPMMPISGLDPSWVFAMSHALSNGFEIGRDVVFTFGPYSAIYTKLFNIKFDFIFLCSSIYLSVMYVFVLYVLFKYKNLKFLWLVAFLFLCLNISLDTILFLYPVICILGMIPVLQETSHKSSKLFFSHCFAFFVLFPIGLLVLVKGTLVIICAAVLFLFFAYLFINNQRLVIITSLVSVFLSASFFWSLAGQNLYILPEYFAGLIPIIFGYTDAMSINGQLREIIFFLIAAVVVVANLFSGRKCNESFFYCGFLLIFLYFNFKQGFVRHDGHAVAAGSAILLATLLSISEYKSKYYKIVMLLSILSWGVIDSHYVSTSTKSLFPVNKFTSFFEGIKTRFNDYESLENRYLASIDLINKEINFPKIAGTSDIYAYNQAYLIASGNNWNPRPIFQSYSAYTPWLLDRNADHLRGSGAPDNIFFKVETIDGRLPSLDDGKSWPMLLSNYTPDNFHNNYIVLKKNLETRDVVFKKLRTTSIKLSETIDVPENDNPVFVKIKIKQNLIGKIVSLLFKSPHFEINVNFNSGDVKKFRIIPKMAESGFIISPFVRETSGFVALYSDTNILNDALVSSISIQPDSFKMLWDESAEIEFFSVQNCIKLNVLPIIDQGIFLFESPRQTVEYRVRDSSIDMINGINPPDKGLLINKLLQVDGWLADSIENGTVPDEIFITLTDHDGRIVYKSADKHVRPDVARHFGKPSLADSGFTVRAIVPDGMSGEYNLGLAYIKNQRLFVCSNNQVQITILPE